MASEEKWDSYARAVVDIAPPTGDPFRLVPDAPGVSGRWPYGLDPPVVVVTAWNPDSADLPPGDNQARNQLLVAELDGLGVTHWAAVGRDLGTPHYEEGMAVSGLTEAEGVALGARYEQAAIYVWTPQEWAVVACVDGSRRTSGWHLTDRPPAPD